MQARALALDLADLEAGQETPVAVALDEGVQDLAVGPDGGGLDRAQVVAAPSRGWRSGAAPRRRSLREDVGGVVHLEGDVPDAVAVQRQPDVQGVVVAQGRGQDQPDVALPQDVGGPVGGTRFPGPGRRPGRNRRPCGRNRPPAWRCRRPIRRDGCASNPGTCNSPLAKRGIRTRFSGFRTGCQ